MDHGEDARHLCRPREDHQGLLFGEPDDGAASANMSKSARKIALVNIDCDLYEFAVPVFDFIDPLLQEGAVIYVDDLFAGYKGHPAQGRRARLSRMAEALALEARAPSRHRLVGPFLHRLSGQSRASTARCDPCKTIRAAASGIFRS